MDESQLAEWPDVLPTIDLDDYELGHIDPVQRTSMVTGRSRSRRVYTNTPTDLSASCMFNNREFALFEGWYRHAISDGADWFKALIKSSRGIRMEVVKFNEISKPRARGGAHWDLPVRIQIRTRPTLTAEETLTAITGGDFGEALDVIDDAANIYYTRYWQR